MGWVYTVVILDTSEPPRGVKMFSDAVLLQCLRMPKNLISPGHYTVTQGMAYTVTH